MLVPVAVELGDSVQRALDDFFAFLPNLLGFLAILVIGYLVAKAIKALVSKALEKFGLDRTLHESDAGQYVENISPGASPSRLVGVVAFWFIFIFALSVAVGALGIPAVTDFMTEVLAYLPNVVVAVLIFVIAAAIAGGLAAVVERTMGDTPTGRVMRTAAPVLVMGIAVFMILTQLRIAQEIVVITYAALMATAVLGLGLAFGLGGRKVAADVLETAYQKSQEQTGQVKQDLERGKERGQQEVQSARSQQEGPGGGGDPPPQQPSSGSYPAA